MIADIAGLVAVEPRLASIRKGLDPERQITGRPPVESTPPPTLR